MGAANKAVGAPVVTQRYSRGACLGWVGWERVDRSQSQHVLPDVGEGGCSNPPVRVSSATTLLAEMHGRNSLRATVTAAGWRAGTTRAGAAKAGASHSYTTRYWTDRRQHPFARLSCEMVRRGAPRWPAGAPRPRASHRVGCILATSRCGTSSRQNVRGGWTYQAT